MKALSPVVAESAPTGSWSNAQAAHTQAIARLNEEYRRELSSLEKQEAEAQTRFETATKAADHAHATDLASRKRVANATLRATLQPVVRAFVDDPTVLAASSVAHTWLAQAAAVSATTGVVIDGRVILEEFAKALVDGQGLEIRSLPRPSNYAGTAYSVALDAVSALSLSPVNRTAAFKTLVELEDTLRQHATSKGPQTWDLDACRSELASQTYFKS